MSALMVYRIRCAAEAAFVAAYIADAERLLQADILSDDWPSMSFIPDRRVWK